MADKPDSLDIGALERSLNDSAGRVSTIWLTFVAFSAYLAAAGSTASHRQLLLEEPIKLPTINIDLPLFASAVVLPAVFVLYHVYVLLQVVLLARTAETYNEAMEHGVLGAVDSARLRQRLANTLFAQLFAGSAREREGLLGALLRLMAWVTLAIAPVLVLLVFQVKFLPYHSWLVTWTHRLLIAADLLAVLLLWAGAVDARRDITWRSLMHHWKAALGAAVLLGLCCVLLTFPGEPHAAWMRVLGGDRGDDGLAECRTPSWLAAVLPRNFDRLAIAGENLVDPDKLTKIESTAKAKKLAPFASERTRNLSGRDLRCGHFAGVGLARADLAGANLSGADFSGAQLEGVSFNGALMHGAAFDGAQMQGTSFIATKRPDGDIDAAAQLRDASLQNAQLQGAQLQWTELQRADFSGAELQGANLEKAAMQEARLGSAQLQGATLDGAELQKATLNGADLQGASLVGAKLQAADLTTAKLHGALLEAAEMQGAKLNGADFQGASLQRANLQRADLTTAKLHGALLDDAQLQGAKLDATVLRAASLKNAELQGARLYGTYLEGARLYRTQLQGASFEATRVDGAAFVEAQLQGARFDRIALRLAAVEHSFLWGASGALSCADALVTEPRFQPIVEMQYDVAIPATRRFEDKPILPTPETIADFISRKVGDVAENEALRATLQERLSAGLQTAEVGETEKQLRDCASEAGARSATHAAALTTLLAGLACGPLPEAKYLAAGLYRNWIDSGAPSSGVATALARAFLGLDDKPCPGTKEFDEAKKAKLREIAQAKPAN